MLRFREPSAGAGKTEVVWNVPLQVRDAGRLTDGQGNEVDFRNVIIMTSNIGAKNIVQKIRESSSSSWRRRTASSWTSPIFLIQSAHARRYFKNSLPNYNRKSNEGLRVFQKLFKIGHDAKEIGLSVRSGPFAENTKIKSFSKTIFRPRHEGDAHFSVTILL